MKINYEFWDKQLNSKVELTEKKLNQIKKKFNSSLKLKQNDQFGQEPIKVEPHTVSLHVALAFVLPGYSY